MAAPDPQAALAEAHRRLELKADDRAALHQAAEAHRQLGDGRSAIEAELAALEASRTHPAVADVRRLLQQRQTAAALDRAQAALGEESDMLALRMLANSAAFMLGRFPEAEQGSRAVLGRLPFFPPALDLLARTLRELDQLEEAASIWRELLKDPQHEGEARRMLAQVHTELNQPEQAEAICQDILSREPGDSAAKLIHGDILRSLGRLPEAEDAYRRVLREAPNRGRALWSLIRYCGARDAELADGLAEALERNPGPPENAALLHFALAEWLHRAGEHEQAFAHFAQGNQLQQQAQPFDSHAFERSMADLRRGLERPLPALSTATPAPLFILGMPRSGSTLLERMLGRHPAIEPLGELATLGRIAPQISDPAELGAAYLARAGARRRENTPFFTDKLHLNWLHLPAILQALPQARILDPRRDPLDCCWSNFRFPFERGHPAASDLAGLGRFHRAYDAIMEQAAAAFPERVLRVGYEDLVDRPEAVLTGVLEWLGLPFDPACLAPEQASGPVATASSEQVRQPLNRAGIGAHRPYRARLGPLIAELGPGS